MDIRKKICKITDVIKNTRIEILLPISSLVIFLMTLIIHFTNSGAFSAYVSDGVVLKFIFGFLFIHAINCLLFSVFARFVVSFAITAILNLFFTVSVNIRYVITGEPLLPSDILLAQDLGNIVSFVNIRLGIWEIILIVAAFLILVGLFYLFRFRKTEIKTGIRIITGGVSAVFIIVFIWLFGFSSSFVSGVLPKMGISVSTLPGNDYLQNGALLTFLPKMTSLSEPEADNYSENVIKQIQSSYAEFSGFESVTDVTPSIITIQNEAWWDPTLLPNAEFDGDPLSTYRSGMENLKSGFMVSPVFGGKTCIPEFEYLTGFSSVFLPSNCYPYIQAVTSEMPSVASVLRSNGYQTAAIHTYKTNFYGRKKAFPLLGFDSFIGSDGMNEEDIRGFYISDHRMGEEIIAAYESKTADKIFIYGLTMQNHGDYTKKRYVWYDVPVVSDKIEANDLQGLNDYTQGAYDADQMFFGLTEYFSEVDEPVLIIMYGDHLPLLGTEGSTYIDGGFIPVEGEFDYTAHEQLFKTPYVVWANYPIDCYNLPDEISPVGLSLFTLKAANLSTVPWHFNLIDRFNAKYPVFTPHVKKNTEKKVSSVSEEDLQLKQDYEAVQYDILYGEKYSLK